MAKPWLKNCLIEKEKKHSPTEPYISVLPCFQTFFFFFFLHVNVSGNVSIFPVLILIHLHVVTLHFLNLLDFFIYFQVISILDFNNMHKFSSISIINSYIHNGGTRKPLFGPRERLDCSDSLKGLSNTNSSLPPTKVVVHLLTCAQKNY